MKRIISIILTFAMVLSLAACAGGNEPAGNSGNSGSSQSASSGTGNESKRPGNTSGSNNDSSVSGTDGDDGDAEGGKILVAYFSATNNTEGIAQKLADGLGADLYEIIPEVPYTDADLDYGNSKSRSSVEMNDPNARPAISGSVEDMDQYDVVFIGYPKL